MRRLCVCLCECEWLEHKEVFLLPNEPAADNDDKSISIEMMLKWSQNGIKKNRLEWDASLHNEFYILETAADQFY